MHNIIPNEIIAHILCFVPPEDNLRGLQRVSKRHHRLANERLLWKSHCWSGFRHWDHSHDFQGKLKLAALHVDWKALWLLRRRRNELVSRLLQGILDSKVGRLRKYEQICLLGYDAKDYLLEQCHVDDSAEDVLARRYYANAALGSIHRSIAIQEWSKFRQPHTVHRHLDRALAGFDMFVLHDREGDIDDIQASLDNYVRQFVAASPGFPRLNTREKALTLLRWVRSQNLTGMVNDPANFRNIRNCLIGHALLDDEHSSLPIISSAIYSSLAQRLGLRSECCAFPAHVHASVFAPSGETLDGKPVTDPCAELEVMFLDPYQSDKEVHIEELRMRLENLGWNHSGATAFMRASPTSVLVSRTAHNIRASYMNYQQSASETEAARHTFRSGDTFFNMEALLYSVLWVNLLMTPTRHQMWDHNLEHFLTRFNKYFSMDAWILRKYLEPLYNEFLSFHPRTHGASLWEDVHKTLEVEHNLDMRIPTVKRRYTEAIRRDVRYRVGQVFIHRRYGFPGIINGWSADGTSSLPQPHLVAVEDVDENGSGEEASEFGHSPLGEHSSSSSGANNVSDDEQIRQVIERCRRVVREEVYYTCMRHDIDRMVVAQENVQLVTDPSLIPETLMRAAGKFFKRFDRETCSFVSNVKEFFPDD